MNYKHGHNKVGKRTATYRAWINMHTRCYRKTSKDYKNYGARGIKVCKQWNKFKYFLKDMGTAPYKLFLDRVNNNKGYNKNNCRWTTRKEQNNNKRNNHRITYNGNKLTISQWAEKLDIKQATIRRRLKLGWTKKETLTLSVI